MLATCLTMRYGNMQDDITMCGHTCVGVNDEACLSQCVAIYV